MPATTRTHLLHATTTARTSSKPYGRHSPTASPAAKSKSRPNSQCQTPLPLLPPAAPHELPAQEPEDPPKSVGAEDGGGDSMIDHPGLPTCAEYKQIEAGYLHSLSPRKRDKALITQAMFDKIWDVLHQPDACTVETPQFRFWVRKMFTLSRLPSPPPPARTRTLNAKMRMSSPLVDAGGQLAVEQRRRGRRDERSMSSDLDAEDEDEGDAEVAADLELERAMGIERGGPEADAALVSGSAVVLHENRPVAIKEQLYELFCYCHVRAGHGGRDKTCAVIRQHYSWVPKELTAQFVKGCPTCMLKRSGGGGVGDLSLARHAGKRTAAAAASAGKERRGRGTAVAKEVLNGSSEAVVWPATGGPLDPANPPPCGVLERERRRTREQAESISPSSLHSPVSRGSRTGSMLGEEVPLESGWNSPFPAYDPVATHSLGTAEIFYPTFSINSAAASVHQDATARNPRTLSLTADCFPCLTSTLSSGTSFPDDTQPGTGLELTFGNATEPVFPIDPVLLSYGYPGLRLRHDRFESGSPNAIVDGSDVSHVNDGPPGLGLGIELGLQAGMDSMSPLPMMSHLFGGGGTIGMWFEVDEPLLPPDLKDQDSPVSRRAVTSDPLSHNDHRFQMIHLPDRPPSRRLRTHSGSHSAAGPLGPRSPGCPRARALRVRRPTTKSGNATLKEEPEGCGSSDDPGIPPTLMAGLDSLVADSNSPPVTAITSWCGGSPASGDAHSSPDSSLLSFEHGGCSPLAAALASSRPGLLYPAANPTSRHRYSDFLVKPVIYGPQSFPVSPMPMMVPVTAMQGDSDLDADEKFGLAGPGVIGPLQCIDWPQSSMTLDTRALRSPNKFEDVSIGGCSPAMMFSLELPCA